ncbi:ATP-binding protein [Roseivirga sp.]|uniref:tetratricopeptide repeat-containing sensor histidine kinase n=1 Tax=Roseivirga sp. TaxID=1964215 RepID=UPI002B269843|nr:ATP-binding protein [Roseivirga sp.]
MRKFFVIAGFFLVIICQVLGQENRFESKKSFDDLINQADRLKAESKYDSALVIFNFLKNKAELENDTLNLIKSNLGIGAVFFLLKETDVARDYYRKLISMAKLINDSSYINKGFYGIGGTYQVDGNLDSAFYYYENTLPYFIGKNQYKDAALILANMASIYYLRGELDLSIETSLKSTEFAKTSDSPQLEGSNLRMLGMIHRVKKEYEESQEYYFGAYRIADANNFLKDKGEALYGLIRLSRDQEDYDKVIRYYENYISVLEDIYLKGENDQILDLKEKYKTASLELENEKQKRSTTIVLLTSMALVLTAFVIINVIDQRRKNIKTLAAKNDELNKQQIDELLQKQEIASLQGVLEGQETERKRVAIDLHDRLGGILSMVKLHFSVVTESLSKDDQTHAKFMKASDLLDQATGEVRSISHNLMSGVLTKFGLVPALEDLKDKISQTGKLKVSLYSNELNNVLTAEQELQLYRIVQELMSNILKHSKAKEANIQLTKGEDSVNLIVEDDGVGFDLKEVNKKAGIGLTNLKARVGKLDGNFHIDSGRGAGTTISIDIPITND